MDRIRRLNRGRSRIHCVQFGLHDDAAADFLRKLAADNNGDFAYQNVKRFAEAGLPAPRRKSTETANGPIRPLCRALSMFASRRSPTSRRTPFRALRSPRFGAGAWPCCFWSPCPSWRGPTTGTAGSSVNVRQLFEAGGVVGVVLAALSVAMVALMIEHLVSLRTRAVNPPKLVEQVQQLMHERQFKIAAKLCRDDGSLLGFVLAAGLTEIGSGYVARREGHGRRLRQYSARLYRKIDSLSVIGTLAPMLGLLGTVWGMMMAFSELRLEAQCQVTGLPAGISTALVTTLMGLAVAIPAYAAFAYFRNRVDEGVSLCSQLADHVFLDYRRAQAARRRKARTLELGQLRSLGQSARPAFPSVAIEREKSA